MKISKQTLFLLSLQFSYSTFLFAGAGHDHGAAPGEQTHSISGPVQISAQAKENIKLQTSEAEFITLEKTLFAIGQIDAIPAKRSQLSSRISGRVIELLVTEGESVVKGQLLAKVESRQPGSPPPLIEFTAPQSGLVTNLHVFKGSNIEPDTHLLDVVDLSEIYGRAQIYEGQISQLAQAQTARIRLEAYPNEIFEGKLERLSAEVDAESRTLPVWFRIKNRDDKIRLNMRATFDIITEENTAAIGVEKAAILGENGNLFVFIEKDSEHFIYEKTPIVVGLNDDRYVEIIEGVLPGDQVVTAGNYQLQYLPVMEIEEVDEHEGHDHGDEAHNHAKEDEDEHAHSHAPRNPKQGSGAEYIKNVIYGLLAGSLLLNIVLFAALARKKQS